MLNSFRQNFMHVIAHPQLSSIWLVGALPLPGGCSAVLVGILPEPGPPGYRVSAHRPELQHEAQVIVLADRRLTGGGEEVDEHGHLRSLGWADS